MSLLNKGKKAVVKGEKAVVEKAAKAHDQMEEKVGNLGGDSLLAGAIIRSVKKMERVNKLLAEKGCDHRINDFEVDDALKTSVVFYVTSKSE